MNVPYANLILIYPFILGSMLFLLFLYAMKVGHCVKDIREQVRLIDFIPGNEDTFPC